MWHLLHRWRYIKKVPNPLYHKKDIVELNSHEMVSVPAGSLSEQYMENMFLMKCTKCGKEKTILPSWD